MDETRVTENNTRTRINLSQTAKGLITFDCTCEYDTPEKSVEELSKTIDLVRKLISDKGLKAVDEVA